MPQQRLLDGIRAAAGRLAGLLALGRADAVAAAVLGLVERAVGPRQHLRGVALAGRDADRDGDHAARVGRVGQGGALDGRAHALGGRQRLARVGVAQDQHELLAAVAVGGVAGAQLHPDGRGDRAQRLVAGDVAELVVVGLEAVDVADRDRERLPVAAGVELDVGQVLDERAAVAQARERVAAGVLAQADVEPRQLRLAARELLARLALALEQRRAAAARAARCGRSACRRREHAHGERELRAHGAGSREAAVDERARAAAKNVARREHAAAAARLVGRDRRLGPAARRARRPRRSPAGRRQQRVDERRARDVAADSSWSDQKMNAIACMARPASTSRGPAPRIWCSEPPTMPAASAPRPSVEHGVGERASRSPIASGDPSIEPDSSATVSAIAAAISGTRLGERHGALACALPAREAQRPGDHEHREAVQKETSATFGERGDVRRSRRRPTRAGRPASARPPAPSSSSGGGAPGARRGRAIHARDRADGRRP